MASSPSCMKRCCFALFIILVSTFLVCYYCMADLGGILKLSKYWTLSRSIINGTGRNGEMCEGLHDIAKEMLNGSRIQLPFNTNHTRWKFYKGESNLKFLNWKSEWEISKKTRDFIKVYNRSKSDEIKVKKHFITFANNCCEHSKLKAVMCALYPGGFDTTMIHNLRSLNAGFKTTHSEILNKARGSGYWIWKPYIILKTMVAMADGDLLMYQDAGAYFIQDAGPLLKLCENARYGILLFYLTLLEQHYTKKDTFILMEMDNTHVYETFQRLASFVFLQKNCKSLQFVMEWLAYASEPSIITDMKSTNKNLPGFIAHRHDQSILSLLSKKWGLTAYRTPSQYGNLLGYNGGPYSQIIVHDRNRS